MYPSTTLCRVQESLQRERATGATLANVRQIAQLAANAWGAEALLAEKRERRPVRIDGRAIDPDAEKRSQCEELDRALSENPDRGQALA
jgi:hypothetical protein